jgi:hypothetical protein
MVALPAHPNWRSFFGETYRKAERQAVNTRAFWDTNMTSWVNAMDGFDEWLLDAPYRSDCSVGSHALGSIGSPALSCNWNQLIVSVMNGPIWPKRCLNFRKT